MICMLWLEKCNCRSLMLIDPVILNKKCKLCCLHFEDKMFSNFQINRLKADAIPTIFGNLTEEVSLQCQDPLNDTIISDNADNSPSCSTSIAGDLSTTNLSVIMSDKSTLSDIETSSLGVQTPKYLSENTPRKLKLHQKLAVEIQ
ncbi:Uncharacterized protein FWK35_00036901, partial [Aphis craccivora]